METSKSEYFHFGLLPETCIHSLDEDEYSKMYIPQQLCDCGCSEWVESTMKIVEDSYCFTFPTKRVHRCKSCNEVRISNHIGIKQSESQG